MPAMDYPGLAASMMASAAPSAVPAHECVMPPRPVIVVSTQESTAKIDTSKSIAELSANDTDTVSPYPMHYHTEISGLMVGEIGLSHSMTFRKSTGDTPGQGCIWVDMVNIEISSDPTIFIASDFRDNECMSREVLRHEQKHVLEDRALLGKYNAEISDRLNIAFWDAGDYASGAVSLNEIGREKYEIETAVKLIVDDMFKEMMAERNKRQQVIDSLEEYSRVMGACLEG
jgi:hypothetical protein